MAVVSPQDSRASKPNSATTRTVNAAVISDVQTSSNSTVPGTDSRTAGAPVDSRQAGNIPQNSRAALG